MEITKRSDYNQRILKLLSEFFLDNPHLRFGQVLNPILRGDIFYSEPEDTYKSIKTYLYNSFGWTEKSMDGNTKSQ